MPSGTYKKAYVKCPFYRYDDDKRKKISCEGIVYNSNITTTFGSKEDYTRHIDTFCCVHYKCCELYRLLMDCKYGEDEYDA